MTALFISRSDYADIANRTASHALEWLWSASPSLGPRAATWTQVMNSGKHLYFPLPGYVVGEGLRVELGTRALAKM